MRALFVLCSFGSGQMADPWADRGPGGGNVCTGVRVLDGLNWSWVMALGAVSDLALAEVI